MDKHGNMKSDAMGDMITKELQQHQAKRARHAFQLIEQQTGAERDNIGSLINGFMAKRVVTRMDVLEVYNPPRAVETAQGMGFRAGWSLGLCNHG